MSEIQIRPEDLQYLFAAIGEEQSNSAIDILAKAEEIKSTTNVFLGEAPSLNYQDLEGKIIQWAKDRMIIPNATPVSQTLKAVSEMGELADAINKKDLDATKDAIGDVVVCLINLCALLDIKLEQCLDGAYNEIKDRKGTLLDSGVFVKE
jgi:uncharacterized protein YabN with tetrapyrrole methylase and pyrophosphatase domain